MIGVRLYFCTPILRPFQRERIWNDFFGDLVVLPIFIGMVEHPDLVGKVPNSRSSDKKNEVDLVAQLVEHNTFNVGALGSSPSGITKI
jgi:hypothetical protein